MTMYRIQSKGKIEILAIEPCFPGFPGSPLKKNGDNFINAINIKKQFQYSFSCSQYPLGVDKCQIHFSS